MPNPTPQEAIVYLMVIMSASDRDMTDVELSRIGAIVRTLPIFGDFEHARVLRVAQECQQWLQRTNGLEEVLDTVAAAIPDDLHDTAYAIALDVAVVDRQVEPEEMRMLQILREKLALDRSNVSAIQKAASIRHRTLGS